METTTTEPTNDATDSNAAVIEHDSAAVGDTTDDNDDQVRIGTISSARFNILSTMVGGGCLSLPMAFQQSGNALVGPLMLLVTGVVTEFCFKTLVASAIAVHRPHPTKQGSDTFESIASEAFGPKAFVFSMGLVVLMCFFGTVGYAVLLRDMMAPLNHAIAPHSASEWLRHNFTMFLVVLLVTPFCTLRRLTALKDCGLASMVSLLILGSCIVVRSVQCNCGRNDDDDDDPWYTHLAFFPESWRDLLDALPLYISCFVCHYNILPVHNELKDPTPARVSWWLRSTTWFAVGLYAIMGFAGSAYAHCTPTGKISGNILLDFDEHDPILMVGRMCLAVTITLAFPMLVIPGRDIVVRSLILPRLGTSPSPASSSSSSIDRSGSSSSTPPVVPTVDEELQEPLLSPDDEQEEEALDEPAAAAVANDDDETSGDATIAAASSTVLLCTSVVIFWTAAGMASVCSSIDIVWDLLGSSLSILLSYLIPAGTYLVITQRLYYSNNNNNNNDQEGYYRMSTSRTVCWILIWVFAPLMVISTVNAVVNTFF